MRWTWMLLLVAGCGSSHKARPPADAARSIDASPPSTEYLAVVTAADNGLAPACAGGKVVPAIAELAGELDCVGGPVTGYRDATVRGHHVVVLLDAAGELRGRFDGQPLDKVRLDEDGPLLRGLPPAQLAALDDTELGALLSTLAGVAMIAPHFRRLGYTPAALAAMRAEWPQQPIAAAPPAVALDHGDRRVRLWYELEDPSGCRELWWSDIWIDGAGKLDTLTHREDEHGETCPPPPPPSEHNIFPD